MFRSIPAENIDGNNDENAKISSYRTNKVGRKEIGQQVNNDLARKFSQDQTSSRRSTCSAKFTSPPNTLEKGKSNLVYGDIVTTPIRQHEPRTPLSQLTESNQPSKRLSRLRSIHSQSPGATFLTQKPIRTPLRKLRAGRNVAINRITPLRALQRPCAKLSIPATDETDPETTTPSLDKRVHFFSNDNAHGGDSMRTPRRSAPNNTQIGSSLHTPRRSAVKNVLRYSPTSHVDGTPKIHQKSIPSPLYVSHKPVSALKRIPLRQTPRLTKTLLSSGPSRVRVQESKQTVIAKSNLQRKTNKNDMESTLQTPSKQLLNPTISSRLSSRSKNTKLIESTPNRKMIVSAHTTKINDVPISISAALELDFDEEEENDICLWQDADTTETPVQEWEINKAVQTEIVVLENESIALDLVDMTENYNQNDESSDSIDSQFRTLDNNIENISVPDTQYARNFDPVAFTLMNNGIEDKEALLIYDRTPCRNIALKHTALIFGERSSDFVPIMSNSLFDVMEHDKVASLARPVATLPENSIKNH